MGVAKTLDATVRVGKGGVGAAPTTVEDEKGKDETEGAANGEGSISLAAAWRGARRATFAFVGLAVDDDDVAGAGAAAR